MQVITGFASRNLNLIHGGTMGHLYPLTFHLASHLWTPGRQTVPGWSLKTSISSYERSRKCKQKTCTCVNSLEKNKNQRHHGTSILRNTVWPVLSILGRKTMDIDNSWIDFRRITLWMWGVSSTLTGVYLMYIFLLPHTKEYFVKDISQV